MCSVHLIAVAAYSDKVLDVLCRRIVSLFKVPGEVWMKIVSMTLLC